MNKIIGILAMLLLSAMAPFVLAQHGGMHSSNGGVDHAGHDSATVDSAQALLLLATKDQRVAFAKCMEAAERVRQIVDQMAGSGSHWRISRIGYDLNAVTEHKEQFEATLAELTAAHRDFRQTLNEVQTTGLKKPLDKLEQLQADLESEAMLLDQKLAMPRRDSLHISTSVYKIAKAAHRWSSEHKKIAKEMNIPV